MTRSSDACGARRATRRRAALLVLAALSFVVGTVAVRSLQGPALSPTLRLRLEAFLAEKDLFDAVYVGSSRVQRGLRPDVVDARLSEDGRPFRSFNLGVAGSQSFETDALIREVLAADPARLRLLVIEAPTWQPERGSRHEGTERFVEWHDLTETRFVLGSIWRTAWPLLEKVSLTWRHLRAFAMRAANYATVDRFWSVPDAAWGRVVRRTAEAQGYVPLDDETGGRAARRRRKFLAHPESYRARVERLAALAAAGRLSDPARLQSYNRVAQRAQLENLARAGVRPVYLAPPTLTRTPDFGSLQEEGLLPGLLDLRDPRAHPDLFDFENHFDNEHVNREGGRRMSLLLADVLEPLVRDRPQPTDSDSQHAVH